MIQQETIDEYLVRHYSDAGFRILQVETNRVYDEAVDVIPCRFSYEETEELIPRDDTEPEDQQEIIEELRALCDEQAEEIASLDEYIIELMYESIIDDLDDLE